jgi:hypothetical protein
MTDEAISPVSAGARRHKDDPHDHDGHRTRRSTANTICVSQAQSQNAATVLTSNSKQSRFWEGETLMVSAKIGSTDAIQ